MTKTQGMTTTLRMFSMGLTDDELAFLREEATRRHLSMATIVRELLSDHLDGFKDVTRDRRVGGSRYA